MLLINKIKSEINKLSNPPQIAFYTKFFRALPGDICQGDKLLAIKIPELRKVIKKYYFVMTLEDAKYFMDSEYNEMRFFGQEVILTKFNKAKAIDEQKILIEFLLANVNSINHWNLVDNCVSEIGQWCWQIQDFTILEQFHNSQSVWKKRIAIVSNIRLFKFGKFDLALRFIQDDLDYNHEYIQKANGWVLRELGKYNEKTLIEFLQFNKSRLPPITKSYATEHLRKTYNIPLLLQ